MKKIILIFTLSLVSSSVFASRNSDNGNFKTYSGLFSYQATTIANLGAVKSSSNLDPFAGLFPSTEAALLAHLNTLSFQAEYESSLLNVNDCPGYVNPSTDTTHYSSTMDYYISNLKTNGMTTYQDTCIIYDLIKHRYSSQDNKCYIAVIKAKNCFNDL